MEIFENIYNKINNFFNVNNNLEDKTIINFDINKKKQIENAQNVVNIQNKYQKKNWNGSSNLNVVSFYDMKPNEQSYNDNNKWSNINNNLTYEIVQKEDFVHNNMFPNIDNKSHSSNQINNEVKLNVYTGYPKDYIKNKKEIENFVNDNYETNYVPLNNDFVISRINQSFAPELRNQKPFEPIKAPTGQSGYGYQSDVRILPLSIDNLRNSSNPQISYNPPTIKGNGILQHNTNICTSKEKKNLLNIDNYSIPTIKNEFHSYTNRNFDLETNGRTINTKEFIGIGDSNIKYYSLDTVGEHLDSSKQTYNIPITNLNSNQYTISLNQDIVKTTNKQINKNNINSNIGATTYSSNAKLQDEIKTTNKQINKNNINSNIGATTYSSNAKLQDEIKTTNKQINKNNTNSNIGETIYLSNAKLQDEIKTTNKQINNNFEYTNLKTSVNNCNIKSQDVARIVLKQLLTYNNNNINIGTIQKNQQSYSTNDLKTTIKQLLNNNNNINNQVISTIKYITSRSYEDTPKTTNKQTLNNINYNIIKTNNLQPKQITDEIKITLRQILENIDNSNVSTYKNHKVYSLDELNSMIKNTLRQLTSNNNNINQNVNSNISNKINDIEEAKETLRQLSMIEYKGNTLNNINIRNNCINDLKITCRQLLENISNFNISTGKSQYIQILDNIRTKITQIYKNIDHTNIGNNQTLLGNIIVKNIKDIKTTFRQLYNEIPHINRGNGNESYVKLMDNLKNTMRQMMDNISISGNIDNSKQNNYIEIQDNIKETIKQLLITENINQGGCHADISNVDYTNLKNILLNKDKELISKGRDPTTVNVPLFSDGNQINICQKERNNYDRENKRENIPFNDLDNNYLTDNNNLFNNKSYIL